MVVFKSFYWYYNSEKIVELFQKLETYHKSMYNNEERIKSIRRSYYVDDYLLLVVLTISCTAMFLSFLVQVGLPT